MSRTRLPVLLVLLLSAATPALACPGDCDRNGEVSLDELVINSRIFFGSSPLSTCPAADVDGDSELTVQEFQATLTAQRAGCGTGGATASAALTQGLVSGTASVTLDSVAGAPGETVSFAATLSTAGQLIAGIQQDIAFDSLTPISGCSVNPAINKEASAFGFQPPGCTPGTDCTAIRALILSFSNVDPIPDGSLLFTCSVDIDPGAPAGTYPLISSNTLASDDIGNALPLDGIDGAITVQLPPTPTPTSAPAPASLILEKVRLKIDTIADPARSNGSLKASGVVNANSPFADLVEDITASGAAIDVGGAGGVSLAVDWDAGDCTQIATAKGPRIRCKASDSLSVRRLDLRPTKTPNLFKMKIAVRRLDIAGPLTADAVRLTLTTTSFAREDFIGGCVLRSSNRVSVCRETGVVPTATPTPTPTNTATETPTPTDTPTPPDDTSIIIGDASGSPGDTVTFDILLETNEDIAGTENEIALLGPAVFTSCQTNPAHGKNLFSSFNPPSCTLGVNCTSMKGLILSFSDLSPIPNNTVLYTCDVTINLGATPGAYPIDCFAPGAATPVGGAVPTDCIDGTLTVTP